MELHIQEQVFRAQLALATELSRTCVVHCVGYYGKLLEIFQATLSSAKNKKRLPPRIVLHSYTGGADLAKAFLALEKKTSGARVFFSLNVKQLTDTRSGKALACCAAIPLRALLLETDAPDQAPLATDVKQVCEKEGGQRLGFEYDETLLASSSGELNEPALVSIAYHRAAAIRGLPLAELAAAVYENSLIAFRVKPQE